MVSSFARLSAAHMDDSTAHVHIVTVPDGCEAASEALLFSGLLEQAGIDASIQRAEYCTDDEAFVAALRAHPGSRVVLPYRREVREFLAHTAGVVRKAGLRVLMAGDGFIREGADRAALPADLETSTATTPAALAEWIGLPRPAPEECGFGFNAFGGVAALGMPQISFFQEPGTLPLMARRGTREDIAPTAQLALFDAPLPEACTLAEGVSLAPLERMGDAVRHIEWRDRDLSPELLLRVRACRERVKEQSVRVMPEGKDSAETLESLVEAGVTRVVFEVDRVTGAEALPGSSAAAEDLEDWVVEARRLQLDTGYLLVVGLPGETRKRGALRVETIRRFLPQHLRCVPFEPTGGTAAWSACETRGFWPPAGEAWIREVIRPLVQASLPPEDFLANWSGALDLLAEVEFRG